MSRESTVRAVTVAKMRLAPEHPAGPGHQGVHPGREWFTVLSRTVRLHLGERVLLVEAGHAAEFSTMVPHSLGSVGGPAEILVILDQDGERAHIPSPARTVVDRTPPPVDAPPRPDVAEAAVVATVPR